MTEMHPRLSQFLFSVLNTQYVIIIIAIKAALSHDFNVGYRYRFIVTQFMRMRQKTNIINKNR